MLILKLSCFCCTTLGELRSEISITIIPVLLGEGIPLFGPLSQDLSLTHRETLSYPFGFVQLKYEIP